MKTRKVWLCVECGVTTLDPESHRTLGHTVNTTGAEIEPMQEEVVNAEYTEAVERELEETEGLVRDLDADYQGVYVKSAGQAEAIKNLERRNARLYRENKDLRRAHERIPKRKELEARCQRLEDAAHDLYDALKMTGRADPDYEHDPIAVAAVKKYRTTLTQPNPVQGEPKMWMESEVDLEGEET